MKKNKNNGSIRPSLLLFGVSLVAIVSIIGIYGFHSQWFDRYDSGADKIATEPVQTHATVVPATVQSEAVQNDPVVIRDKGASFKMTPRANSNQVAVFLSEETVRAMQKNNK